MSNKYYSIIYLFLIALAISGFAFLIININYFMVIEVFAAIGFSLLSFRRLTMKQDDKQLHIVFGVIVVAAATTALMLAGLYAPFWNLG